MSKLSSEFYDLVGEWLINEKGCKRNEFSHGYVKDIQFENKKKVDIFGLKYVLNEKNNSSNNLDFCGYAVDIIESYENILYCYERICDDYKTIKKSKELINGLNQIYLYLAFIGDTIPEKFITISEEKKIGILRLDKENVVEVLEPKEISLGDGVSNRKQKSPGNFEKAIEGSLPLKKILINPDNIYDTFLRPKLDNNNQKNKFIHIERYNEKNLGTEKLANQIYNRIKTNYPKIESRAVGSRNEENKIIFELPNENSELFQIDLTKEYLYIRIKDGKIFRIYPNGDILEFLEEYSGNTVPYNEGIDNLINNELIPVVENSYPKNTDLPYEFNYCRSESAKKALDYAYSWITDEFPDITLVKNKNDENLISFLSPKTNKELLCIDIKSKYFYIQAINGVSYRINSYSDIVEFPKESEPGKNSESNLKDLLETCIFTRIRENYN